MIGPALRNPHLVVVVALVVALLGAVALWQLPADLLPLFETSAVQIVTFYPGMPPVVMERDIMSRLQRWTGQSVGIARQEAKAMLGVCVVKDFFREGISLDTAMSQVTSYAVSDMFYLPPGTIPPMVMPFDPTAAIPLCLVSIASPTMNEKELYDIAYYELRNRLQSIEGVIAPAVYGGKLRRILAYLDPRKLAAFGLSPMDVVRALREQNVFIPAGNMKIGARDYQIFANNMPRRVAELNDLPVAVRGGRVILLRDVARARDSAQIQTNIVRVNGRRQVYIPIYRQPGANTIRIVNAIRRNLERILTRLREMDRTGKAQSLTLEVVLDQSVYVRRTIQGLLVAGGLGALLASLVVFLFLRQLRATLIVFVVIPLSLFAAAVGLFYTGNSLNTMTLGGLALAVGILVDQAIVVLENIVRHVRAGKPPREAAYLGAREVAAPLFVSTLTFIVVFYPVVFLSGMAKYLFRPLGLAVTFALLASYLAAMTLIPAYAARFFRRRSGSQPPPPPSRFARWVGVAVRARWLVLPLAVLLFLAALLGLSQAGTELFPPVDAGQFTIYVRLPSGTRIERTEAVLAEVEREIIRLIGEPDPEYPRRERHPDSNLRMLITNIGVLMDWPAAYTPNTGPMDAFVLVQLKGKPGKPGTFPLVAALRARLREAFPGVEFAFDTGGLLTAALNQGEPAPLHIQVSGSRLEVSHEIAQEIARLVKQVPGTADVRIAQRLDYPILEVHVDRVKAALHGITVEDVMKNLVTATNSSINFDPAFWIDEGNGNHYFIGAQYYEEDLQALDALLDLPLTGRRGPHVRVPVRLRDLVQIRRATGPAVVNHVNITRVIDVYATVEPGYRTGDVAAAVERVLRASPRLKPVRHTSERGDYYAVTGPRYAGKGYAFTLTGEIHAMRSAFREFGFGLVIAVVLIYLVMVAQFRSFADPFVILFTVPLGLVGVAAVLLLTKTAVNIPSFMGVIMMSGIVVEYSIVLLAFANERLRAGRSPAEAVAEAAAVRLRPILMTSLTTILALLPMALGLAGGEANAPLARSIVGGVAAATVLSLFVVPCLYVVVKRSRPVAEKG